MPLSTAKAQLAGLVQAAEAGEVVHISSHGRPVAVLLSEQAFAALQGQQQGQQVWHADDWPLGSDASGQQDAVLPDDRQAALWHGEQRARLESKGVRPAFADGQIAAIAATQELVLVTRNPRDFAAFEGLQVVNWFSQP